MAAPSAPVSQPAPLQDTSETPTPAVPLHHPIPDLQSLQGAYIHNVERLEDRAERMSEAGSDLGQEIRKIQLGLRQSESRSSLHSAGPVPEDSAKPSAARSRNASTSSYANSIRDVNTAARYGMYSSGGYVTSPAGSLRSGGSFSAQVPSSRQRSGSRASRLGQVVHLEEGEMDVRGQDDAPGSPWSHASGHLSHHSVSSLNQPYGPIDQSTYDQMQQAAYAQMQQDQYAQMQQGQYAQMQQDAYAQMQQATYEQMMEEAFSGQQGIGWDYPAPDGTYNQPYDDTIPDQLPLPDRPLTAASYATADQVRLWQDFDGAHAPDAVPEGVPTQFSPNGSRNSSLLRAPAGPSVKVMPPPDEGMVFYPAPVPQMLNLPKRLSKVPAANVQARRRTQLLESMQAENRRSAPMLSATEPGLTKLNRKSRQNLAKLPPQLRASAYFDQVAPTQQFDVRGESAQDTLESILDASTHAPVSAFTDHPIVGHVGSEVYGREKDTHRVSKAVPKAVDLDKVDARKSKSSLNLLDTRRNSSGDLLNKLKKRNSSADLNMLTVKATESRVSLGDELDEPDADARGPEHLSDRTPTRRSLDGDDASHADEEAGEDQPPVGYDEEPIFMGAPTTLLAELQKRKVQQKSRNLTAMDSSRHGYQVTLLELDAVAEVEKKKRTKQKINLAWEAPPDAGPEDDDSEDEVPLAVLFPGHEGLVHAKDNKRATVAPQSQWDRPLGLLAQKELYDNEPLSRRRTRLIETNAGKRKTQPPGVSLSQPDLTLPQPVEAHTGSDEEGEEETLAQRLRRLKEEKALDDALGPDVRKSTISGDFAAEMMSQFGVADEDKPKPAATPDNEEEETLGQRRARLKADALARGDANPMGTRPPLRGSVSLANILSQHPIDTTNAARKITDDALVSSLPPGSLLAQNAMAKSRRDAERAEVNHRVSSYGSLTQPPVASADRLAGSPAKSSGLRAPSVMFNSRNSMTPASMPTLNPRDSYFPQANMPVQMPMGMGMNMNMPQTTPFVYPGSNMMPPQQMGNMGMMGMPMNGMAGPYGQMGGMRQSSMMTLPTMGNMSMSMGMGMGMGLQSNMMMMEPPMDPKQRASIDRWRNGVMH
ncbi:hypothetical protein M011DRAFT_465964 [Sporormia fimetaria CBS 119925]|uniref:Uncharacterized protein n=1 Tax=Sporormia fimetaria CBS 119925 TaxID=1340428 RepID=A0A6A6VII7_9PLEO|nr:hypothetical protein M011DRAFT_465964 [Sporormia fimetaria CBS 119925]